MRQIGINDSTELVTGCNGCLFLNLRKHEERMRQNGELLSHNYIHANTQVIFCIFITNPSHTVSAIFLNIFFILTGNGDEDQ